MASTSNESLRSESAHGVILFDGVCNLCNGAVSFVLKRDPGGYFRFASLQSKAGEGWLRQCGLEAGTMDTLVLIEGGRAYERSEGTLRILRRLRMPWNFFWALWLVPRPLRDVLYRWIARHRYAWFGRLATCMVPTPDQRRRFLDA
jgi:predicted DCC family thiol-disulfide oxidoreductase YuxK